MNIVILYKTSRGLFSDIDVASMAGNRAKEGDIRSPLYGLREPVKHVVALSHEGKYYELTPLDVK